MRKNSWNTSHASLYQAYDSVWNDVVRGDQAKAGKLEFNLVAVAIGQLGTDLVLDLQLKEDNPHRLYDTPCVVEEGVPGMGQTREMRKSVQSLLVCLVLFPVPKASVDYKLCRGSPEGIC
jgi:hypothetical protein